MSSAHASPGLGPWRRGVREVGLGLIVLGLIVLLFVVYQLLGTNLTEEHHQSQLKQSFDRALAARAAHVRATTTNGSAGTAKSGTGGQSVTKAKSGTTPTTAAAADNPTVGGSTAAATPSSTPSGLAIDYLVIPKIGIERYVVEGVDESDLSEGPGHYPGTVLPGQLGNAAIAGHRTTYGAPFFRLDEVGIGDDIFITNTAGEQYTYQVKSSTVVSPSDTAVLDPSKTAELTLTTCNPRYGASSRLVVVAVLTKSTPPTSARPTISSTPTSSPSRSASSTTIGTTATTATATTAPSSSATAPAVVTAGLNLGGGNRSARLPAIAYGLLVILLWVVARLAINRSRRWTRVAAFVVGIGVCLIPLWFCFENVVRLLPADI